MGTVAVGTAVDLGPADGRPTSSVPAAGIAVLADTVERVVPVQIVLLGTVELLGDPFAVLVAVECAVH